jgi:hypothetical protein
MPSGSSMVGDVAEGADDLGEAFDVAAGVRAEEIVDAAGCGGQGGGDEVVVVDGGVGAHLPHPGPGLLAGGGGEDTDAGDPFGELDHDRAHASGGAQDQQGAGVLRGEAEAVEEGFPGGDGRQGQGRRLGEAE